MGRKELIEKNIETVFALTVLSSLNNEKLLGQMLFYFNDLLYINLKIYFGQNRHILSVYFH